MGSRTTSDLCRSCKPGNEYKKHVEHNAQNPFPDGITYVKIKKERKPMKEIPETRVCAGAYCPYGEESQPIANFNASATSKIPFKLCKICKAAESICKIHEVELADIRGGQGLKVPGKTKAVQEIVETLRELMDVSIANIAELLGITPAAVYSRLDKIKKPKPKDKPEDKPTLHVSKPITIDPPNFTLPQEAPDSDSQAVINKAFETANETATSLTASAMAAISANALIDNPYQYRLTIDFSNHQDVFNDLIDVAERQLRDPASQALFVLRYVYEKGLKISEQIQPDD